MVLAQSRLTEGSSCELVIARADESNMRFPDRKGIVSEQPREGKGTTISKSFGRQESAETLPEETSSTQQHGTSHPLACHECQKVFSDSVGLNRHMQSQHSHTNVAFERSHAIARDCNESSRGKLNRNAYTTETSTNSGIVPSSANSTDSPSLAIMKHPVTEKDKKIIETFFSVPAKSRKRRMPQDFYPNGKMKDKVRNRLGPLLKELQKSCESCQQAILVCNRGNQGSCCTACLISGKDCSLVSSLKADDSSVMLGSKRRKTGMWTEGQTQIGQSGPPKTTTGDEEYDPNRRPSSMTIMEMTQVAEVAEALSEREHQTLSASGTERTQQGPAQPNPSEGLSNIDSCGQPAPQSTFNPLEFENMNEILHKANVSSRPFVFLDQERHDGEVQSDVVVPTTPLHKGAQHKKYCDATVQTISGAQSHQGHMVVVLLEKSMPTLYGRDNLDDESLDGYFTRLSSLIRQHSRHTKEAAKWASFLKSKLKELELCSPQHNLLQSLREILVVPLGVNIIDQVIHWQLQDVDTMCLTRAVLAVHVRDMIFSGKPPFEDEVLWREDLQYSLGPEVTDMLFQNRRIKLSMSVEFEEEMLNKMDNDVMQMNRAMFPMVGGDDIIQGYHRDLAKCANEVYTKVGAFTGNWSGIWAGFGAEFDPNLHKLENTNHLNDQDLSDRRILMTLCPGIRRQALGGNRWTCVKAVVVLLDTRPPD